MSRRWTRTGRQLAYDGVPALRIDRILDDSGHAPLSPVQADAIADRICDHLNSIDLGALTRVWMRKP